MVFLDRENGSKIELSIIQGCTYWENKSGEIYAIDRIREYAWPVRPSFALKSILLRSEMNKSEEKAYQFKCCQKIEFGAFKGHEENYLSSYKK